MGDVKVFQVMMLVLQIGVQLRGPRLCALGVFVIVVH